MIHVIPWPEYLAKLNTQAAAKPKADEPPPAKKAAKRPKARKSEG